MNQKTAILSNIQIKIKSLQEAYDQIKNLPEDVFEAMSSSEFQPSLNGTTLANSNTNNSFDNEYGGNKKYVYEIIKNGKGVDRKTLLNLFYKKFPDAGEQAVSTALVALQREGKVYKEKPKGVKLKGYYWYAK